MTAFDDRKTAAEAKFTHDQEFQFKTMARRNKLLGLCSRRRATPAPSTVRRDNQLETALAWNLRAHSHHQKLSPQFHS